VTLSPWLGRKSPCLGRSVRRFLSCLPSLPRSAGISQEIKPNPINQYQRHGYINDFAGMIDSQAQSKLGPICKDLDKKKGTQLVFVTDKSLEGLPVATQLANRWGVAYKDTNRGIFLVTRSKERRAELETLAAPKLSAW
jgi:uncharacterized membrane protein YgcG